MFSKEKLHAFVQQNQQEAIDCLVELLQTPSTTEQKDTISKVFARRITRGRL